MELHTIKLQFKRKTKKRVGRGGKRGTYSGRGQKGQMSRAGSSWRQDFRGGDKRIWKSFPKQRGATKKVEVKHRRFSQAKNQPAVVNLGKINEIFKDGENVTRSILIKKGIISTGKKGVKILGTGELNKKLVFEGFSVSDSAKTKIEKSGSTIKLSNK